MRRRRSRVGARRNAAIVAVALATALATALAALACAPATEIGPAAAKSARTLAEGDAHTPRTAPAHENAPAPAVPPLDDAQHTPERRVQRIALGTLVEIVVRDADGARAAELIERAFAEIARLEALLSEWRPGSEISRLSTSAGGAALDLSPETADVLIRARAIAEETDGAFDPTVLPLVRLFGFAGGTPRLPSAREVDRARAHVGWRKLEVQASPPRARLTERGMAVGLGAIGKGFIADRALAEMRAHGASAALVKAAGDFAGFGGTALRPWPIAIEDPDRPGEILATFDLQHGGVSTSAPTYRHFEAKGARTHHILDPRTGWPARGARSVTVIAGEATRSDAWSTALFVMGAQGPRALAAQRDLRGVILLEDGTRFVSAGLDVRFVR